MRTALGIRERTNSFSRLQLCDGAVGWCRVIEFYRGVQCVPRRVGSDMSLRKAYSEALARLVTPDLASGVPVGGGTMNGSGGAITVIGGDLPVVAWVRQGGQHCCRDSEQT